MTLFDYAVLTIVGASVLLSIFRGFVREVLALAAWVLVFVRGISHEDRGDVRDERRELELGPIDRLRDREQAVEVHRAVDLVQIVALEREVPQLAAIDGQGRIADLGQGGIVRQHPAGAWQPEPRPIR